MSTQRFSAGKRFHWHGTTYEIRRWFPEEGKVSVEDILTGTVQPMDLSILVKALFDGELRFIIEDKHTGPDVDGEALVGNTYLDLEDYPEHLISIARYRLEVIAPLLQLTPESRTEGIVEKRVREVQARNAEHPEEHTLFTALSVRSAYRWLRDYTQGGNDLRALIPDTGKRGGKSQSRLTPGVEAIVEAVIQDKYYVREMVTTDDILGEVVVRIEEENRSRSGQERLTPPSRASVARRIATLDERSKFEAKHGKRATKQAFSQYGSTEYPQVPLERVEIDHTMIDLIVIDDRDSLPLGRLTLTYCLDMATRYPLGYYMGFEPPGYLAVMECLHHAICPKENTRERYGTENEWRAYGIPLTLVIDNGKEFVGKGLQDACLLLGIVLQQTPVKTPHFKAGIERLFGTLNTMLFHTLPGTTFSNAQKRGDYDSVKQACVYLSDVDKIMNLFVVDIYAQRFHRGVEDIPAQRWDKAMRLGFAPRVPPSAEELTILLGRMTHRVVQHYGIQLHSLRYNASELTLLRTRLKGEKVKVKYHPGDLSRIHVYDPFDGRYIEVPALDQEYTCGLSLWKHRIIYRAALEVSDSVDLVALGRAKRKIQEIVDAGRDRKRLHTRSRIARWETGGKPTREMDPEEGDASPGEPVVPSAEDFPSETSPLATIDLDEEGWEISYDLPRGASSRNA
ncbi:MAG: Transposon Tn7 transposition protein TnsB [Chloroflexi bacterium ADurb.Bin360]|nr:MAG: Transposon Tn7 transposition protein TnsB [Chloroflexi bacterium ADurb.Bin360]